MATRSILVEDCSPLIQYAPDNAWRDAELNDTLATSYSGGSYHATSTPGANATFQFHGTGFAITGGRRPGYGPFSIILDGQQLYNGNPAPESSPIGVTLASFADLSNEQHTVVLTNTGGGLIDIDTISFETQIGSTGNLDVMTIDDTDPRIRYSPQGAWNTNSRPEFQDSTLHFSQVPNASASLQFTGNAIAYYGTVAPDHADISISIDNETITMPSGSLSNVNAVRTQVLMWWADGLADGEHTVTITKAPGAVSRPFVDLDSFVVYSEAQVPAANNSTPGHPAVLSDAVSHTGVIVGAAVAGAVAVLLIIAGLFLFLRQRRQSRNRKALKSRISSITPILPMQGIMESESARPPVSDPNGAGSAFPFPPSAPLTPQRKAQFNFKRTSKLSIAPSYYGDSDFSGDGMSERRTQMASGTSDPSRSPVPRLKMPRTPASFPTTPVIVATDDASSLPQSPRPSRPKRPPPLNIGPLQ